MKFHKDLFSC